MARSMQWSIFQRFPKLQLLWLLPITTCRPSCAVSIKFQDRGYQTLSKVRTLCSCKIWKTSFKASTSLSCAACVTSLAWLSQHRESCRATMDTTRRSLLNLTVTVSTAAYLLIPICKWALIWAWTWEWASVSQKTLRTKKVLQWWLITTCSWSRH